MNLELLKKRLHDRLIRSGLTVSTAESCTAGGIASALTDLAGSSVFFQGGAVVYSNALKGRLLHVKDDTLRLHGAVSENTAEEMAVGVRSLCRTDLAVAVTGIAGPDGGTPEKPAGTVFCAAASARGVQVRKFFFKGGRSAVRRAAIRSALEMFLSIIPD